MMVEAIGTDSQQESGGSDFWLGAALAAAVGISILVATYQFAGKGGKGKAYAKGYLAAVSHQGRARGRVRSVS